MEINIKKAKLCKGSCVEATYFDADGNEIMLKGSNRCHPDLKTAIRALVPYFVDITEQREADSIDWDNLDSPENQELLSKIEVTGVSIGGGDSSRIITLTGKRNLMTSKVLNINSPCIEMDSEILDWEHVDTFDMAVKGFIYEVREYILNRKWEVMQPELDFGDGDNPDDPFADGQPTDDLPPIADVA